MNKTKRNSNTVATLAIEVSICGEQFIYLSDVACSTERCAAWFYRELIIIINVDEFFFPVMFMLSYNSWKKPSIDMILHTLNEHNQYDIFLYNPR